MAGALAPYGPPWRRGSPCAPTFPDGPSATETVYAHLLTDDHSGAVAALDGLDVPADPANNAVQFRREPVAMTGSNGIAEPIRNGR
jgi:hypothetical protein